MGRIIEEKEKKKQGRKDLPWKIIKSSCQRDGGLFAKLLPIAHVWYLGQTCELCRLLHVGREAFPDTAAATQAASKNDTVVIHLVERSSLAETLGDPGKQA